MAELPKGTKYSTYLFAIPSLWESLSRPLDLAGATSELNLLGVEEIDDLLAIAADWAAIGEDFWAAIGKEGHGSETMDEVALALLALLLDLAEDKKL